MGSCVSTPAGRVKRRKRHQKKCTKTLQNTDGTKKRSSDAGSLVTDFAVSQYVHMDFEKGSTTTCRRSEVSNSAFHLTQMQWHLSQVEANGMSFRFVQYQQLFRWDISNNLFPCLFYHNLMCKLLRKKLLGLLCNSKLICGNSFT